MSNTSWNNLFACLIVLLLISACASTGGTTVPSDLKSSIQIHQLLADFYQKNGGNERLGSSISDLIVKGELKCQYTENALICFDPKAPDSKKYYLASLGRDMGIKDKPDPAPSKQDKRYENGFWIFPDFVSKAKEFGAGNPISRFHYDYSKQRIVQYFERLGLYRLFDDPEKKVHLLPYGQMACGGQCNSSPVQADEFFIPSRDVEQIFSDQLERMGGARIFGRALSPVYLASDGNYEQIFENIVVTASQNNPQQISFRPLGKILGTNTDTPEVKKFDRRNNMIFYPTNGDLGYHVPLSFDEFIWNYTSGMSGNPTSAVRLSNGDVANQNFENFTLEYHKVSTPEMQVRLAPLGIQYYEKVFGAQPTSTPKPTRTPSARSQGKKPTATSQSSATISPENNLTEFDFKINAAFPEVTSQGKQFIFMLVYDKTTLVPIKQVVGSLQLQFSNGIVYSYTIGPTADNGWASFSVPVLKEAVHNETVLYTVCIPSEGDNPQCQSGSYLIWDLQ